jgi:hypothetical protein
MFERLICVSRRLRRFFHRWHSYNLRFIIPIVIIILILSCVIRPPVYMFQPQVFEYVAIKYLLSLKLHRKVSIKWEKYFQEIHLGINYATIRCLFSELIGTGTIIILFENIVDHIKQIVINYGKDTREQHSVFTFFLYCWTFYCRQKIWDMKGSFNKLFFKVVACRIKRVGIYSRLTNKFF